MIRPCQRRWHGCCAALGVATLTASNGRGALGLLERHADSVGVVISDYAMDDMNGADFLSAVRLRWPHMAPILLTGTSDMLGAARAVNHAHVCRLFTKPWYADDMLQALVEVLGDQPVGRDLTLATSSETRWHPAQDVRGAAPRRAESLSEQRPCSIPPAVPSARRAALMVEARLALGYYAVGG